VDTSLDAVSEDLGIVLSREESRANVRTLLRTVWKKFLGDFTGFVDMLARHVPSPSENARDRVESLYTGKGAPEDSEVPMMVFFF
jgi:U5 small nuclear ribonucleoprotein component